jgi:hypothetical protein
MKKQSTWVGLFVVGILVLSTGCSKQNGFASAPSNSPDNLMDLRKIANSKSNPTDQAEQLALAGERLVYGTGLMYADSVFDEALKYDAANVRARFYKAMLAPVMKLKGAVARARPLTDRLPPYERDRYQQWTMSIPQGDINDFLTDGQPNIRTEKDAQDLVRSIQASYRDMRQTLGDLRDKPLTLHTLVPVQGVSAKTVSTSCTTEKINSYTFKIHSCDVLLNRDYKLNYADYEALRLVAASHIIYMSQVTAYDLTGLENVMNRYLQSNGKMSEAEFVASVKNEASLGNLVESSSLKEILTFGAEGVDDVKMAYNSQKELCPYGKETPQNRPGQLFSNGFCYVPGALSKLALVESALRGPVELFYTRQDSAIADFTKPLNGSVTDLKTILPTKFNRCGNATAIPDVTLGGLFVRGDSVDYIRKTGNPSFLNKPCP